MNTQKKIGTSENAGNKKKFTDAEINCKNTSIERNTK